MTTYEVWFDAKQEDGSYWKGQRKFIYLKGAQNWLDQVIKANPKYRSSKDKVCGVNVIE